MWSASRASCPVCAYVRRAAEPVCLCIHRWPLWCFVFVSYFVAVPINRDRTYAISSCKEPFAIRIHFVNYIGNGSAVGRAHLCACVDSSGDWSGYVYILFICMCAIHAIDAQIQYWTGGTCELFETWWWPKVNGLNGNYPARHTKKALTSTTATTTIHASGPAMWPQRVYSLEMENNAHRTKWLIGSCNGSSIIIS